MKKLQILIIALLITASICAFASIQVRGQITTVTVPAPTLSPSGSVTVDTILNLSVTISSGIPPPTGSATFQLKIGSGSFSDIGPAINLNSQGFASTTYTPLIAGDYQFQVFYSGDSNYNSAYSVSSTSLTVNLATATVGAATFTPVSPITLGGSVTVSATVSGSSGVPAPTGNVQFQVSINGGSYANFGSAVGLSGGSASVSYTPSTATTYNFKAVYQGDSNYVSGTAGVASGTLTVNLATATVGAATFTPVSPITLGGSVTVSATVSGSSGVPAPTGNVQFQVSINGGSYANFGSAVGLSGGSASVSYTPSTATTYNFKAVYQGDSNYVSGTAGVASGTLTVNLATATVGAATFTPVSPITLGGSVTVSATVSGSSGVPAPTGNVQFQVSINGGSYANFGSAVGLSGGSASVSYTPSTATTYNFKAVYQGDSNYVSGTAGVASGTLTVNLATATVGAATFTPVSPITLGGSVTVSATVSGSSGVPAPTGNVQFQVSINGGSYANFGSAVGLSGGSASVSYTPSTATTYNFKAVYQGDSNYVSGTAGVASGTLTVNLATATVGAATFTPVSPITLGGSVTVSATVSGSSGVPAPTGNVQFQVSINGGSYANFGSAVGLSGGSASVSYTPSTATTYNFKAVYQGDSNYVSGTAGVASGTLTVNKGPATVPAPTLSPSGTVTVGNIVSLSITVSGSGVTPTGTAAFQVKIGSSSYSTIGSAATLNNAGSASTTYTPSLAGSYQFQVVYSGDSNYNSLTGSSASLTVNPASVASFVVSGFPSPTVAGVSHTITVTAKDAFNNTVTGYSGTVKITSSDSAAVLPPNNVLTSGVGSFTVILKTAGSQSIIATDTVNSSITGSESGITVNVASGTYFVVSGFPSPTVAGVSHPVTVTAKDIYGNTVTGYSGTVKITSSDGAAGLPSNAGLTNGVGSFTVILKTAGSQSIIATDTVNNSITGLQNGITVNAASLDHFTFNAIGPQEVVLAFNITVTADDAYNNTITSYNGTPSLTYSAGTISPSTMTAFVNGVGSTLVSVTAAGSAVTIKATDGTHNGTSNSFVVSNSPTPSPTATPSPTPTPTPTSSASPTPIPTSSSSPTSTPTPTATIGATPTPTLSPTPSPSTTNVTATTASGATIELTISGNVTSSQISNATITSDQSTKTAIVSFTLSGSSGAIAFCNITIPKTAIFGTSSVVYIDGQQAPNQGYTQDANNLYVWFTSSFSTHQVSIEFVASQTQTPVTSPIGPSLIIGITVAEIISVFTVIAVRRLRRKPDNV